ncbi:sugar ABC transporter substrate-binding protein [Azospirillum sp. TSH100]|uniref:ABC transporter ATP-binding protein n=1 Tax=Azospirillum sp. TSH100 TaxID=652764 RepID=UPI000D608A2D|nr:ABC transporter ATP-binding protein [Azospirillum sp. TSH100]PWC87423.1 sugar ABC transporter substrate-binding protein [Azospirillum sp. TSH100]QCG89785.1 ABC transporter ATP-binding protein [Azospirillum sp. TSH100]
MSIASKPAGVEFRNVSRRYNNVAAVDDVSFTIEQGTLVTLLGPSGCGKTTTLRMIAGLEMASSGTILIGGKDVTRLPATDRNVTMVFQSYALFPHMSVADNVAYGLVVSGVRKRDAAAKAEEGLDLVGLGGYGQRLPSELSGGQQQRVAVARALVLEPEVLLFDEPLSNLDAKLRRKMRDDIRELQQKLGLTSVYVTHDQEEALAVSDRIIVMNRSVIAQTGTPDELYRRPKNRFVADFIGGANLIDGELVGRGGGMATVALGPLTLTVPDPGLPAGEVLLAVRPNAIRLRPGATSETGSDGIPVTVRKATYLGSHMEYGLTSEFGDLFVVDPNVATPVPAGASALATFTGDGIAAVAR